MNWNQGVLRSRPYNKKNNGVFDKETKVFKIILSYFHKIKTTSTLNLFPYQFHENPIFNPRRIIQIQINKISLYIFFWISIFICDHPNKPITIHTNKNQIT